MARTQKPSAVRALFPLENRLGMLSLLAGKPNGALFPFHALRFDVPDAMDPSTTRTLTVDPSLLAEGLQYSLVDGLPPFVEWLTSFQEREHCRERNEGWRVSSTVGSQDALHKAFSVLIDPGDCVIAEQPCFPGAISLFQMVGAEMIAAQMDHHGVITSSLRTLLENWPSEKPKPKCFYTVPFGGNPSGVTTSLDRRLEVLKLARQHNFLILEDDPYYYLYFGSTPRPPSYFSLEASSGEVGRVLRFDSFSKVLAAGMRVGFVTGPWAIINALDVYTGKTNLQASTLVHSMVLTLLREWGYEGFKSHVARVAAFYKQRRDTFEAAMRRHLSGLAEWSTPEAGMFVWFKLLLGEKQDMDTVELIGTKACAANVLALPGTVFFADSRQTPYVRASFSLLEEQYIDEALRRLRMVILAEREAPQQ
ncbi:PLP-dependent transferase [Vararia minispora EC-137]|uniref:PLP-dependent transferase n=1 Tax=Vararia minispora EC-137 TaxID=1314806 RepID=A0ACB8QSE8_9AGAM|nr:PLP-dependent transferase [Vararia minispora EC-137]